MMVDAFEERLHNWYIEPTEVLLESGQSNLTRKFVRWITGRQDGGHYSFAVASMTCLLIDCLSQFRYGELSSDGGIFKRFVADDLKSYDAPLPTSVWHYEAKHARDGNELTTMAQVLWSGFRCGFLHQAHAPLYCAVVPGNSPMTCVPGHATYGPRSRQTPGSDCLVVILQPEHLFNEVKEFLRDYLGKLKTNDPINDSLRENFVKKFSDAFGIDITAASL